MPVGVGWRPGQTRAARVAVPERSEAVPDRSRVWTVLALAAILLISLARLPHLNFPLERDEGEFGYIAQQLLHGVPVYVSAHTHKLPGTYMVYALFLSLLGQSTFAIHFGLLLVNAAIMGLVFLTLRQTHGGLAGVTGTLVFGFMALSPTVLGFAAHATFLVALFSMAGLYLFLLARDRSGFPFYLASGLCFGLAFLMKQPGIFFAPLFVGFLLVLVLLTPARESKRSQRLNQTLTFGVGSLAPFVVTAAHYLAIGKFDLLWYWSFQVAREFVGQVALSDGVKNFFDRTVMVTSGFEILWILGFAGFLVILRDALTGKRGSPYLLFGLGSVLSIVPGLYFLRHYYVSLLPFVALAVGILVGTARGRAQTVVCGTLVAAGLIVGFVRYEPYFTGRAPDTVVSHAMYPGNPFPESIEIAQYLKSHTAPGDSIAILGSETQIYFQAERASASRYVNVFYLTADHPRNRDMQLEMIQDIERVRPRYLIYVHIPWSWAMRSNSPRDLIHWYEGYRTNYTVEGVVQKGRRGSVSTWGADARAMSPTRSYIEILRRIDEGGPAEGADGGSATPNTG